MQNKAEKFCALIREFPDLTVALNVKELGYEDDLIQFLMHESIIHQVFLFDMELLESVPGKTASLFRELNPNVQIAARVSDRGESIDRALAISYAKIVWADEFETLWITSSIIKELKAAGKLIYVISPEIHGFPLDVAKQRWSQFIEWGSGWYLHRLRDGTAKIIS